MPFCSFVSVVRNILLAVARKISRLWLAVLRTRKTSLRPAHAAEKQSSLLFRCVCAALEDVRTLYNSKDQQLMETLDIIDRLVKTYGLSLEAEAQAA